MYFSKVTPFSLKLAILTSVASFLLTGCSSRTSPPAAVEYDHTISPYHRVGKGESIAVIAKKYHMDKMELVRLNGLQPPYRIFVGQKLLVKPAAASAKLQTDDFESPAVVDGSIGEGPVEMKGDVEVKTLEPLKGTEPAAPFSSPSSPAKTEETAPAAEEEVSETHAPAVEEAEEIKETTAMASPPAAAGTFEWPVKGKILKGFKTGANNNDGINISAPKGTPVNATNNGIVAHTGNQVAGLGNIILLKHANGFMSVYTHLDDIKVKKGQEVKAGEKIGTVGKTGNVKEPQLHFELRKGKTPIDPTHYLH